jgi:hypothetical protein
VDARKGLDLMEKRKNLPLPGIEPLPSSSYPVIPIELSRLHARQLMRFKSVVNLKRGHAALHISMTVECHRNQSQYITG